MVGRFESVVLRGAAVACRVARLAGEDAGHPRSWAMSDAVPRQPGGRTGVRARDFDRRAGVRRVVTISDPTAFIRANTNLGQAALVPEISLYLASEITPIWQATEDWLHER